MIRLGRRASLLVAFSLFASAATAHAECAWVLARGPWRSVGANTRLRLKQGLRSGANTGDQAIRLPPFLPPRHRRPAWAEAEVNDTRGRLVAALGFAGLPLPWYDRALDALQAWLDSWSGIGPLPARMWQPR
jgi:hypothetical protein